MKLLKNIFSKFHVYVLWLLASVIFWAWIFTIITDTRPPYKVTLFADTYDAKTTELAQKLEEHRPEGIKMIKVRLFQYAMFTGDEINHADLFIIRESEAEKYISAFEPLENLPLSFDSTKCYTFEGVNYGIPVYENGIGILTDYLTYEIDGEPTERYYLFFGAQSTHLGTENSMDQAAITVAEELLSLQ